MYAELLQKFESGDLVGMSQETLDGIGEAVATLFNYPTDYPDATTHSTLTDGTQVAQSGWRSVTLTKTTPSGATAPFDTSGMVKGFFQVETLGSGAQQFQVQVSNNGGTTWSTVSSRRLSTTGTLGIWASQPTNAASVGDLYEFPVAAPLMRINITGTLSSGTTTLQVYLTSAPMQPVSVLVDAQNALSVSQSSTPWSMAGNVAHAATDSGNPIKVGGKYNSSAPTLTNGQRGDAQLDAAANLKIVEQYAPGYEDNVVGVAKVEQRFSVSRLASAATTTVKSGLGLLHTVNVTVAGASSTITVYDNTAGSGTVIATIDGSVTNSFLFDAAFNTGLTFVIAGATPPDVSLTYR